MHIRVAAGFILATTIALSAVWSFAQSKEIPLKDLPAKVSDAVKAKWPKAKIVRAEAQKDKGQTLYNLELAEASGKQQRKFGATLTADGKIDEVQEPAKLADVPKPVLAALAKKYPTIKKPRVDKVTEGEGAAARVMYEFRFGTQMRIDSAGKTLDEIEIELDEGKEE
ncbi:MAG: PepSY-like domain-containing protein [Planctomycetia bacterium]|nr:PepSY-like domain-containing protein [Planctomycetia bacterium]